MPIDDLLLAKQAQQGDREAFGQLYDHYIKKIYNFLYYKCFSRETAEDLTSIVFTKALERLRSFTPRGEGAFAAWLYRIARNTYTDYLRGHRGDVALEEKHDAPEMISSIRRIEAADDLARVQAALNCLPELQREIVVMRVWQDMSYKEIAHALGKSEASCKVMFSRTVKSLRKQLPIATLLLFIFCV